MSNPILVKRSAVPGKVPTVGQLPEGSIAMNTADKRMFFSASNSITLLANLSDLIWGNISGKPTTIGGFGLTDAYTKLEVDTALLSKVSTALIGANSGVASLDSTGKIPSSQLPALAITDTYVVASQAAMLALTAAEVGDICVRTDLNKSFILKTAGYATLANWQELLTPTDTVTSVNGQTGAVSITTITGNAGTATTLANSRTISHSGDVTGSASFNGGSNITIAMTLAASGVTAGTYPKVTVDAKGRVTAGAALAATDIPALDWSKITTGKPTTVTGYGIVLTAGDIPNLDWAKITTGKPTTLSGYGITDGVSSSVLGVASGVATLDATGKVPAAQLPSYVDDVIEGANLAAFPATGETGKMYVALDTNKVYRWSGSTYVEISGSPGSTDAVVEGTTNLYFTTARAAAAAPVQSVNGQTGTVSITSITGNAGTATKLAAAKNISVTGDAAGTAPFDGSADASIALTLANVVTAGSGIKVSYNAKGLVTGSSGLVAADIPALDWSKLTTGVPTTLGGFGITDAYTKSATDTLLSAKIATSAIGTANGVASLDAGGKIPSAQLPALAITDTYVVASQAAMLALTAAEVGDICVRTDLNKSFILKATGYATLANWQELLTPTDSVLSVNGQTGAVSITSVTGNAGTATALQTARNIAVTGDATGTSTFNGTADASIALTFANSGVSAGTYPKVTVNAKGLVTGGAALVAADIPSLDWSKITTGTPTTLSGYGITDADLVAGQIRRTTTLALTTTATEITFDTIDFANNTNVITRGTPTSRLVALVAGVYEITFECESINTTNANLDLYQIRKNGVAVPQGLATVNPRASRMKISETVVLSLAANDYITVAASSNTGTTGTMQIGASLLMTRMQGSAGQDGAQGPQGYPGAPGGQYSVYYSAANLDNPSNANWAVNALAPATADTANAGLTVRAFDDTAEEGVGMTIYVPPGMTNVILTMTGKCATAPATAKAIIPKLYARSINIGAAVGAWSAGTIMTALNIPTNNFYQSYQQTFTVASLGLTAGNSGQLELTRVGSNAGDTLVGDFHLLNLTVSFT